MATPISIERPAASGTAAAPRKLASVQGLRAIAALLVVWTHSIDAASAFSPTRQSGFFHLAGWGACGLDIFFVISGFIVSLVAARVVEKKEQSAGQFLSRRFTRIYPLYWILTAIIVLEGELGQHPLAWQHVSWLPTTLLLPSLSRRLLQFFHWDGALSSRCTFTLFWLHGWRSHRARWCEIRFIFWPGSLRLGLRSGLSVRY